MRIEMRPVLTLTKRQVASFLQKEAVKDKNLANILFSNGLNGNVTPKFVDKFYPGAFETNGTLTPKAKRVLKNTLKLLHLSKDTSVRDFKKNIFETFQDFQLNFNEKDIAELQKVL